MSLSPFSFPLDCEQTPTQPHAIVRFRFKKPGGLPAHPIVEIPPDRSQCPLRRPSSLCRISVRCRFTKPLDALTRAGKYAFRPQDFLHFRRSTIVAPACQAATIPPPPVFSKLTAPPCREKEAGQFRPALNPAPACDLGSSLVEHRISHCCQCTDGGHTWGRFFPRSLSTRPLGEPRRPAIRQFAAVE